MVKLSQAYRATALATMRAAPVDVLVVGGGITGAGVALDAVLRGYSVALVEKNDFASGTSSKSTKLVHGGIRYLPNLDFPLVREALVERGLLLKTAPHLVHPLAFVLPIYQGDQHPVGVPFSTPGGVGMGAVLASGLWLYDLMAGRQGIKLHHRLTPSGVLREAPALEPAGLKDGFVYFDAQTDDARLTMAVLQTAVQHGALIANHVEVTGFTRDGERVTGVTARDRLDGATMTIAARYVVNATGVFGERTAALSGVEPPIKVAPSKGVHLTFPLEKVKLGDHAIVLPQTSDGRILFIVPWKSRAIFGTTDTGSGDLDHPRATAEDITYLLEHLNRYLTTHLTPDDILSVYAGYRPLVTHRTTASASKKLSRTHLVLESQPHLISVFGGKLTTYRKMAQDAVDVISRHERDRLTNPTAEVILYGGVGWPAYQPELTREVAALGLGADIAVHLGQCYGTAARGVLELIRDDPALGERLAPDLPYLWAEVTYAMRAEMALTLADVLARRTSIILEDQQRGETLAPAVAARMARELGWSASEEQAQVAEYRELARANSATAILERHIPAVSSGRD